MAVDNSHISVKAMLIAPNADRSAHAATFNLPTQENPQGFHRLIGGTVEFGEPHRHTIRREVAEELGAQVHDLELVTVLENIFHYNGDLGHEIVFVYTGRLDPLPAVEGASLTESDGTIMPVVWLPVDADPAVPLYPSGAQAWIAGLLHR